MLAQIDRHLQYHVVDDDDGGEGQRERGEDVVVEVEEEDDADDSVEIVKEVATVASTSSCHGQREGYCLYFCATKLRRIIRKICPKQKTCSKYQIEAAKAYYSYS
jgi:hypothetical protein